MFVRLTVTSITADQTSDSQDGPLGIFGLFDHTDEDYFLISGASVNDGATSFRVTPPQSDHFDISDHQTLNNIILWEGFIGDKAGAFFNIAVRDRKNAVWSSVLNIAEAAALVAGTILLEDPGLGQQAVAALGNTAKEFVANLKGDNDKNLGILSIRLLAQGDKVQPTWQVQADTELLSGPNDTTANFFLTGANCKYRMQIDVQVLNLPMIVSVGSQKCIDVPGFATDAIELQQFTINRGQNQRWYLKNLGFTLLNPKVQPGVRLAGLPFLNTTFIYALLNSWSGKAFDVTGGSDQEHTNIQQYKPHYGPDQQFALVQVLNEEGFLIVNVQSGMSLDVRDASHANGAKIQQLITNGQANERWTFQW
jgi:hypothetical protein